MSVERIVSGGQTGVDRAALDVALQLGIPCGGWCPLGRRAEDGPIDEKYPLRETDSADYAQRTEWNVRDSDGTMILTFGTPSGGTALTAALAKRLHKPCMLIDLDEFPVQASVVEWLRVNRISVLNVAGPRDDAGLRVYTRACEFLRQLFGGIEDSRQ